MCYNSCHYFDSHRETCRKPKWAKCTDDIDNEVEELERERDLALEKLEADFEEKYPDIYWMEDDKIREEFDRQYDEIESKYDKLISDCENYNYDTKEYIDMQKSEDY